MIENINNKLTFLTIFILINVFILYSKSFYNDIPTCDNYVTNVYLYVLLGLLITAFTLLFITKRNYPITLTKSLIAFAVCFIALFSLFMIKPEQIYLNHFIWLIFIISIGVSLYSIWRYSIYSGTITNTLIILFIMLSSLTAIAHFKPEWIKLSWGTGLTVSLLAGILAWLIPMFFIDKFNSYENYYKFLSFIFVIIFMFLVLYDTKVLKLKASTCTYPNYPLDSLGLFLDVINLFNSITMLS